jgi:HprK-related kinase B
VSDPDALVDSTPTPHELTLRFGDVTAAVATNDADVWTALSLYWAPYVTGTEPAVRVGGAPAVRVTLVHGAIDAPGEFADVVRAGARRVKEAVRDVEGGRLIAKRQTGVVMGLRPGRAWAIGDLRANLNQAVNLVNACYAKTVLTRGYVMLHASAVARDGRAIVFAGVPGAGKSTAALHLVEAGWRFVSNDRVLARADEDDVDVRGYPKQPRVNPGTLVGHPRLAALLKPEERETLAAMDRRALWDLERKSDVDLDAIYGGGTVQLGARMHALVLLTWRLEGRGIAVRRLTVGEALAKARVFEKDLGVFDPDRVVVGRAGDESVERYRDVLERVPIVEVSGAPDFGALARLAGDLLALRAR